MCYKNQYANCLNKTTGCSVVLIYSFEDLLVTKGSKLEILWAFIEVTYGMASLENISTALNLGSFILAGCNC